MLSSVFRSAAQFVDAVMLEIRAHQFQIRSFHVCVKAKKQNDQSPQKRAPGGPGRLENGCEVNERCHQTLTVTVAVILHYIPDKRNSHHCLVEPCGSAPKYEKKAFILKYKHQVRSLLYSLH